jgi:hypothetical protein
MKPGDIVRVNTHLFAQLAGKIGVVVEETTSKSVAWPSGRRTYKVLVDGCIYHFYQESLEPLNETR